MSGNERKSQSMLMAPTQFPLGGERGGQHSTGTPGRNDRKTVSKHDSELTEV